MTNELNHLTETETNKTTTTAASLAPATTTASPAPAAPSTAAPVEVDSWYEDAAAADTPAAKRGADLAPEDKPGRHGGSGDGAASGAGADGSGRGGPVDRDDDPFARAGDDGFTSGGAAGGAASGPREKHVLETNWTKKAASFDDMELPMDVLRGVFAHGFDTPSEIQSLAIVPFKSGRDTVAQAQSGTGKTGTFTISVLSRLNDLGVLGDGRGVKAIVLSHTRELADQTWSVFQEISQYMLGGKGVGVHKSVGKTPMRDDCRAIRSGDVDIVVGTPGRVAHLLRERVIDEREVRIMVLDEADELLNEGFAETIQEIAEMLPKDVQVGLYSATMPPATRDMAATFMRDPAVVFVPAEKLSLAGIKQYRVYIEPRGMSIDAAKFDALCDLWGSVSINQSIIFVNSVRQCERLTEALRDENFPAIAMHGDLDQTERTDIMRKFRKGDYRVLVATDVIARGIDVQGVSLVINFDFPSRDLENYLHRVGRSGRHGRKGTAINFVGPREVRALEDTERLYKIEIGHLPGDVETTVNGPRV